MVSRLVVMAWCVGVSLVGNTLLLERVSTAVPFPRGLAMVDGKLHVLARGRVRGAGGVSAEIDDRAGTLFIVDPRISEAADAPEVSAAVRNNGTVLTLPTSPPFSLWNREATPPESDRLTDRPYCTLRWHEPTQSFYICAFSGIDKQRSADDPIHFSKNLTDALLRYDMRTKRWHEVERHRGSAGGSYPHHDPRHHPPPHGWLNGPDNCLPLGRWLYAVAKDNNLLVRYDLRALVADPHAGPPASEVVLDERVPLSDGGVAEWYGHSALAAHGGYLYVGCRTSSVIFRLPLGDDFAPKKPVAAQLVARFEPFDPHTGASANLTDMTFDHQGRLYVVSAEPARIFRFQPDPAQPFDGREGAAAPWADLAAMTTNPSMKSENVLWHGGWLYVTSGDGYGYQNGAHGTVYRLSTENGGDNADSIGL